MNLDDFQRSADCLKPHLEGEPNQFAESIALRQDMVTFLRFIKQNKIAGTKSTGNMPLKMVRQLSRELANPPALENKVGDKIYKVRSELDIWAIYFPHILAEGGGLVQISQNRQWRLTPIGENFIETPALIQLWTIVMIWWHRVNWLVSFPIMGIGDKLPDGFELFTLESLILNANNNPIPFHEFADLLIEKTGLIWTSKDKTFHQILLRGAIENIVININKQFGILETEYGDDFIGKYKTKRLKFFNITTVGKILIESIGASFF